MNNKLYDALKFVAQIALPAVGTLYFAVAQIWGLPFGEEVVGTITAVDAFLGALLGLSSAAYNKSDARFDGLLNVGDGKYSLELNHDPDGLAELQSVSFKVVNNGS